MARNINMPRGGNGNIPGNNRWNNPPIRSGSKGKPTSVELWDGFGDAWRDAWSPKPMTPITAVKSPKIKAAKEVHVVPAAEAEKPLSIDPFVASHRVGVIDRITNMDPMSEEFIRSLNLQSSGQRMGTWANLMSTKFFSTINGAYMSRMIKTWITYIGELQIYDIGAAGKPWSKDAWIVPRFQIGTGIVVPSDTVDCQTRFQAAEFCLNLWKVRPAEMETAVAGIGIKVKVTLVNHFEAVRGLQCYSFVIKHGNEEALYHVWLNDAIFREGRKGLPMYFEMGGAPNFIMNAMVACFGFSINAKGELKLGVQFKDRVVTVDLSYRHLAELQSRRILSETSGAVLGHGQAAIGFDFSDNYVVGWDACPGANWSNLGLLISTNTTWTPYGDLKHLPWQVQPLLKKFIERVGRITLKLPTSPFESSKKASDYLVRPVKERVEQASRLLSRSFWQSLQGHITEFDDAIREIRQIYIDEGIIEELKRLYPDITGTEIEEILTNRSDRAGRFVFERSDPAFKMIRTEVPQVVEAMSEVTEDRVVATSE